MTNPICRHQAKMLHLLSLLLLLTPSGTIRGQVSNTSSSEDHIYAIDVARSRFTVYAYRGGLLGRFGHDHTIEVRMFEGEISVRGGDVESSYLRISADAASLEPIDDVKEEEREEIATTMKTEVLNVVLFPAITYTSDTIDVTARDSENIIETVVAGRLTLHGVRRKVAFPVTVAIATDSIHAVGEFVLNQKDFGIKPVSVMGGLVKVKDQVKIVFDLIALRLHE